MLSARGGDAVEEGEDALAIERAFPSLAGLLPRVRLTDLPTAVRPLTALGRAAGLEALWIKRDDLSAALYGGNKPRKLELVLGAAVDRRRQTVVTFGGIGSHHGMATTLYARRLGIRTILVLVPQPLTPHVRRTLLLQHALGAELHLARGVMHAGAVALRVLAREALAGRAPMLVPAGGTSVPGVIGYASAALELAEQIRAGDMPEPTAIFAPLGTGGTVAGLALGVRLAGLRSRVIGVLVTDILPPTPARLARLGGAALRRLRRLGPGVPALALEARDVEVVSGWLGEGYGAPTAAGEAARALMEDAEGIRLETTYTAKCLAAMLALARDEALRGRPLLFWNTFSAVDPGAGCELPSPEALPPAFRRLLA